MTRLSHDSLQPLSMLGAEFLELWGDDDLAVRIGIAFAGEIFLVVILGLVPFGQRFDGGDDRRRTIRLGAFDRGAGFCFLFGRMRKDRRAILRADLIALAVELRRILNL